MANLYFLIPLLLDFLFVKFPWRNQDGKRSFSFQVILVELCPGGFQRSFFDEDDLNIIAEGDNVYAFQAPPPLGQETLAGTIVLEYCGFQV